jgi:PAS domain S-box-containing protein
MLKSARFDVIIADYYLGDGTLFDIFNLLGDTPIIIATGAGDEDVAVKAMKEGAYDYLIKDLDRNYLKVLPVVINNAINHKKSEKQFRMLSHAIMNIYDSVYLTDMNDRIIFVNQSFCKTYGYNEEDVLGKQSITLWKEESTGERTKNILSKITEFGYKGEFYHKRKDGTEFPVSLSRSIIKDEAGNELAIIGVARDITERKRAEEALQRAKETAESATHAKTEFLANMSHEIRTPLNAIIGMTELTLETTLNVEQHEYLKVIQSSSEALLSLIDDILDFSKIEMGQIEVEKITFDLREVVEGVADILSVRAAAKGLELLCYVDPKLPRWVVGDPTRLRQILVNLVGNGIKFTNEGEITIKVEPFKDRVKTKAKAKEVKLHFMVSDTGIGIPKKKHAKIFEKFSQADTSTTRKFGGTGLGLSISKSLVELMGGQMWLESEEGRGSTFHFKLRLPIGKGGLEEKIDYEYPDFRKISILVVDDTVTNRFILHKTLSAWEFQVQEAGGGVEALSLLRNPGSEFSLVILDHEMPEMDGVEVARAIRGEDRFKNVKIVMLSSWGGLDSGLLQQLDISQLIVKPVKQSKLFDILMQVLRIQKKKGEVPTRHEPVKRPQLRRHCRILLVEDNADNQNLARRILEKGGYCVDVAENGAKAVEAVRRFHYDLILMDVQMPVKDGFEATREIRELEQEVDEERVPIIALTAHAVQGYREKCLKFDMDDYITKPIRKQSLLDKVAQWIDLRPTILVLDDSMDNRVLMGNYLMKEGAYRAVFANNGQEAVDIFERRAISLILIDMEMPVRDGHKAIKAIRNSKNGAKVPIIALTAHQGKAELEKCLQAGCTFYLPKPIRKQKLMRNIDKYLENYEYQFETTNNTDVNLEYKS